MPLTDFLIIKTANAQTQPAPEAAPTAGVEGLGGSINNELPAMMGDGAAAASHTVVELFLRADIVVQSVMLALILASIWCWAIIIDKIVKLRRVRAQTRKFEDEFWSGDSLEKLYNRIRKREAPIIPSPMEKVFIAGMEEWQRSSANKGQLNHVMQERIERIMQMTSNRELNRLERYLTFLASVGSSAPFIGLFGTVWGIMNSFASIAASKQTSLAVVAPGISEALLATALGLVAAIPATIGYNKLSSDINHYAAKLDDFQAEMAAIFSRQDDEG